MSYFTETYSFIIEFSVTLSGFINTQGNICYIEMQNRVSPKSTILCSFWVILKKVLTSREQGKPTSLTRGESGEAGLDHPQNCKNLVR